MCLSGAFFCVLCYLFISSPQCTRFCCATRKASVGRHSCGHVGTVWEVCKSYTHTQTHAKRTHKNRARSTNSSKHNENDQSRGCARVFPCFDAERTDIYIFLNAEIRTIRNIQLCAPKRNTQGCTTSARSKEREKQIHFEFIHLFCVALQY